MTVHFLCYVVYVHCKNTCVLVCIPLRKCQIEPVNDVIQCTKYNSVQTVVHANRVANMLFEGYVNVVNDVMFECWFQLSYITSMISTSVLYFFFTCVYLRKFLILGNVSRI